MVEHASPAEAGVYDRVDSSACGTAMSDPIWVVMCVTDYDQSALVNGDDLNRFTLAFDRGR